MARRGLGTKVNKSLTRGMNRPSSHPIRRTAAFSLAAAAEHGATDQSSIQDDLKLFFLTWLGGLVFFGTLFG